MREIFFTPGDFETGASYIAELSFNGNIIQTMTPLPDVPNGFVVTVPGTYKIVVRKIGDSICSVPVYVDALFPIVQYAESEVDCNVNTYSYTLTLSNPSSAGSNIQYGWSLLNQSSSVTNWTSNSVFSLPADNLPRYFFVKNSGSCTVGVSSTQKNPCVFCTLTVTNVVFSCG